MADKTTVLCRYCETYFIADTSEDGKIKCPVCQSLFEVADLKKMTEEDMPELSKEALTENDFKYDIYLCAKEFETDELGRAKLDEKGERIKSKDFMDAFALYGLLRKNFPNLKVFFIPSSDIQNKIRFASLKELIKSAIFSSRVFILVSRNIKDAKDEEIEEQINGYLKGIVNYGTANRSILTVTDSAIYNFPNELKKHSFMSLGNTTSYQKIIDFVNNAISKKELMASLMTKRLVAYQSKQRSDAAPITPGKGFCDVFIAVNEDEQLEFAKDMYYYIKEMANLKVFFVQSNETKRRLEKEDKYALINESLQDAKAFVLIAENKESLNSASLNKLWRDYIDLVKEDPKNRHLVLLTHNLRQDDLPESLKKEKIICFPSLTANDELKEFIENALKIKLND